MRNTETDYGIIAVFLHWIMALLIPALFIAGVYMTDLSYYDSLYHLLPWWHKSMGLMVMALLLFRGAWRLINPTPTPLTSHQTWMVKSARATHCVFYLLILLITISGYLMSTADGHGIDFFGAYNVPAVTELSPVHTDLMGVAHFYLAWALIVLLVVHVLAALKHHFIDKDSTLKHITLRK